ncbi:pseudouridine synthase [Massilia sp. TWR1-2-2]|uniref:pseudouridine synthase n=1 Tax=Massilia sp. TWR1-2-2 TaxID=2804584 RepID=UPI003CEDDEB9
MGRQAAINALVPLPIMQGVAPSYLWLPQGSAGLMLDFLVTRFPDIGADAWRSRMARGHVVDGDGLPLAPASPVRAGSRIWYYRELDAETPIPFYERVLFQDEHLVVVDKPHFLPMAPAGRFLHETLLVRLKLKLGIPDLVPIHRLDRETAGVVLFSPNVGSRGAYQSLFQQRGVSKEYEALAAPIDGLAYPHTRRSLMVEGTPFFRMQEVKGEPNSETIVDMIGMRGELALYRLRPHTGRKHQLRVHMAALGAPIHNDAFYPVAQPCRGDDFTRPLQLLARSLEFLDPLSGAARRFASERTLGDYKV